MNIVISRKDLRDTTSGVPRLVLQETEFFTKRNHQCFVLAESLHRPMIRAVGGQGVKTMKWPISGYYRRKFYQRQVDRWIKK